MVVLSNWSALVEGLSTSSQDAYLELQGALAAREVPEIEFSRVVYAESGVGSAKREYLRIQRKDFVFDVCAAPFGKSFFFSWWMAIPPLPFAPLWTAAFFLLVLLGTAVVQYPFGDGCLSYIVLGLAPFALTLFFMMLMKVGAVLNEGYALRIPIVGRLYRILFAPETYYTTDTQAMFECSVHSSLLEVVEGKISEQGLKALGPDDRRPSRRSPTLDLGAILGMFK